MAELLVQTNLLREENERLRIQLEATWAELLREPPRPLPPSSHGKGKEAVIPDDIDLPADDELSFGSSPLLRRSSSPNAAEAYSRKRPSRPLSQSISVARHRTRREPSVRLFLYRLKPLKITQLQEPYNSLIPMSLWIIWLAKIIFS